MRLDLLSRLYILIIFKSVSPLKKLLFAQCASSTIQKFSITSGKGGFRSGGKKNENLGKTLKHSRSFTDLPAIYALYMEKWSHDATTSSKGCSAKAGWNFE